MSKIYECNVFFGKKSDMYVRMITIASEYVEAKLYFTNELLKKYETIKKNIDCDCFDFEYELTVDITTYCKFENYIKNNIDDSIICYDKENSFEILSVY